MERPSVIIVYVDNRHVITTADNPRCSKCCKREESRPKSRLSKLFEAVFNEGVKDTAKWIVKRLLLPLLIWLVLSFTQCVKSDGRGPEPSRGPVLISAGLLLLWKVLIPGLSISPVSARRLFRIFFPRNRRWLCVSLG